MPLYGIFLDSLGSVTDIRTTYYDNKPYKTKDLTRLKNRIEKIYIKKPEPKEEA
jgi:hypothetical protein